MIPQIGPIVPAVPGVPATTETKAEPPEPVPPLSETPKIDPASTDRPVRPTTEADATDPALADAPYPGEADDPNSPAGPPPAFEASVLDRTLEAQEAQVRSEAVEAPPEPGAERSDTSADTDAAPAEASDPYEVPPSKAERAMEDVGTLRRIEIPLDTATVDITR